MTNENQPNSASRARKRIAAVVGLCACWLVIFLYYQATRGRLANRSAADRRANIQAAFRGYYDSSDRTVLARMREYALDYPKSVDADFRLHLAEEIAASPSPDWTFVADTVEEVALQTANEARPERLKSAFASRFMPADRYYSGWPAPLVVADTDGDGSQDVVLAAPPDTAGVCLLLRHTKSGWVSDRLAIGEPVKSIWKFPITPHGPVAIAVAAIPDSEYDPNMMFDVFVYQNGAVRNVLSTRIPHGWQWDHKDRDGSGTQTIRLVARAQRTGWPTDAHYDILYRWNGAEYVSTSSAPKPARKDVSQSLKLGLDQFERGNYSSVASTLKSVIDAKPGEYEDLTNEKLEARYVIGLSAAMLGDYPAARAAMLQCKTKDDDGSGKIVTEDSQIRQSHVSVPALARRFLAVAENADTLRDGLAAVGQVLRVLKTEAAAAAPGTTPDTIVSATHLHLDAVHDTGTSGARVTSMSWSDGSAVIAWTRDAAHWKLHLLAYGMARPAPGESGLYAIEPALWMSLPETPVFQVSPVAGRVSLGDVSGGSQPRIHIEANGSADNASAVIVQNGESFTLEAGQGQQKMDLHEQLSEVESALFKQRQYGASLEQLSVLEAAVLRSDLSEPDQADMLHEIYYHQAICCRKSGDTTRAEVILSALQRSDTDSQWGAAAKYWLNGSGLPGTKMDFEDWVPNLRRFWPRWHRAAGYYDAGVVRWQPENSR